MRPIGLLVLALLVGCGTGRVRETSAEQGKNCERVAEIAAIGVPPETLNLGPARPPLPDGLDEPRGVILEPLMLRGTVVADPSAPNVGVPDPFLRKLVIVSRTKVAVPELKQRLETELIEAGHPALADREEIRSGGRLVQFTLTYGGGDRFGTARTLECRGSSWVIVSQTLPR